MVHTRSQTQASRDATRAHIQNVRDAYHSKKQSMTDAAQLKIDQYIASCKPSNNQTQQMSSSTPSTPVKQTQNITTPTAPFKQNRYNTRSTINSNLGNEEEQEKEVTTPQKHRYNTRLSSGSIQNKNLTIDLSIEPNELSTTGNNLSFVFDAAFFDDASKAWKQNKTKLGNGMYSYNTRSASKKN